MIACEGIGILLCVHVARLLPVGWGRVHVWSNSVRPRALVYDIWMWLYDHRPGGPTRTRLVDWLAMGLSDDSPAAQGCSHRAPTGPVVAITACSQEACKTDPPHTFTHKGGYVLQDPRNC